ncbi:hypothetical protein SAMN05216417_10526 [Nitrosospira multiformis]|uniref:Uncharacterized protein n=1 Tax=Nitrosospira multiformis TaxID=1231 RepID=A0A1I7GK90_9PROT|nr:hypothetical protein SAMN05216417_10526 [Nitrosospira multiformis]
MGEISEMSCRSRILLFWRLSAGEDRQGDGHSGPLQDLISLQAGITGIHKIKVLLEELLFRIIASPSSRARAWSYTEI